MSKHPDDIDDIDRAILRNLQRNGRMTNVELAGRVGISAPPCLRRVRALEAAGLIRGYHAVLDGERLGYEVAFFALVGLSSQAQATLKAFEQMVAAWPEVRECHMIRGGGDFLLKILAHNTSHENELTTRLTDSPQVTKVSTFQVIRSAKTEPGAPIDGPAAEGDSLSSPAT